MAEYNEQFATKNIALTDLSQITKVQVGYDTDGNFKDVFEGSGEYLNLSLTRNVEATYAATNTELTRINIIKIVGRVHPTDNDIVLAYRPLEYTLDIVPNEDSQIAVHVVLFTTVNGQIEGTIELNYLIHSNVANPQTVHEYIEDLPYQSSIGTLVSSNFPCIIDNLGNNNFDNDSTNVQRKNGTPVYFSGRGHTYSNLLWYYWNTDKISDFLTLLANKFNEDNQHSELSNYVLSLIAKISSQNPLLGFNARYGSYLYWYNITANYICVICAGSNHYNAVDIFIVPNSINIAPKQCQFFDNNNREFRIKFNRWYNHLYFIADNKAYQINTNLESGHAVYAQEIRESFDYIDSNDGSDELVYNIRAFQTEQADAIQIVPLFNDDDNSTKYYQLEFSDIGDVLIGSFNNSEGTTTLFIRNIFDPIYESYSLEQTVNTLDLYDSELSLFNKYSIDDAQSAYRLMGLYQTTLVHLQYFLKNNYVPIYLGEEYSIGWSNVYQNYLTLFKTPTMLARRRTASDWLDNILWIEQGKIKHYYGLTENIYTGELSVIAENYLACERGVCVKEEKIGVARNIASNSTQEIPLSNWIYNSADTVAACDIDNSYDQLISDYPSSSEFLLVFEDETDKYILPAYLREKYSPNVWDYKFRTPLNDTLTSIWLKPFAMTANSSSNYSILLYPDDEFETFPENSVFMQKFFTIDKVNKTCTLKEHCTATLTRQGSI